MYEVIEKKTKYPVLTDISTRKEAGRLMFDLYAQDKRDGCFEKGCYEVMEMKFSHLFI